MRSKLFVLLILFASANAQAIPTDSWYLHGSYYSQNALYKTTSEKTSQASMLGQTYFPLGVTYTTNLWGYVFSPRLEYTLIPTKAPGGAADKTILLLGLPFGSNFYESWDWDFGPAITMYTVKGAGGTKVLNNGGTTATFAQPGSTVSSLLLSLTTSVGYNTTSMRFSLGTNINGAFSNKRSFDLFLMIQYKL